MSTSVVPEDSGAAIEVVAVCIVIVNGEVPCSAAPPQRAEEIVDGDKCCPLPFVEDVTQIVVTIGQVAYVGQVGLRVNTQQVVEVYFVCIVILLVVEVQLIGHLVGQVVSLLASRFVIHSRGTHPGCHCHHHCHHVTSHSRMF